MSDDFQGSVESALVILTPEVEPLVAPFRLEHDPSADMGVPAHITINYPFLPGVEPGEGLHRNLKELFAKAEPFQFTFRRFVRLPDMLYLAPEPDAPFKQLIALVADRFPESPPYEGAYDEIIPHLTIAQSHDEEVLQSVERELAMRSREYLPITVRATHVWLIDNRGGIWQRMSSYPLGRVTEDSPR
jgi:2'-5' RNA ligase